MSFKNNIYESEYHDIGKDDRFALPHHDNSIEIIQTWSDGGYFIVKNNIFPIKPGNVFIVNAMEIHYSNPSDPDSYNRSKLIISADFFKAIMQTCALSEFADKSILERGGICFNPRFETAQIIDNLLQNAAHIFQKSESDFAQANIVNIIISILTQLMSSESEGPTFNTKHTINQLAKYVNEHNNNWDKLSLENICSALHISPSRASHLFKELMGKTIIQYKNELRISEAKKLLLSTNLNIFEISDILHFQNSTIFCKYFKKMVGCTAKQYRDSKGLSIRMD